MIKIESPEQYETIDSLIDLLDQIVPFRKIVQDASWDAYSKWDDIWGRCSDCDNLHGDCECEPDEEDDDEYDEDEEEDEDVDQVEETVRFPEESADATVGPIKPS